MSSKFHKLLSSSVKSVGAKVLFGSGDMKQVFIVRTDLEMGKGKIAAQCCHAAVQAYSALSKRGADAQKAIDRWEWQGSRKVVVKVNSEEELRDIIAKAKVSGIYASTIRDAGKTQIAAGSTTVGVIGPANEKLIDEVSGHLKLL
jgi:peptidyl-tRNA hydrolase, PTH2 family